MKAFTKGTVFTSQVTFGSGNRKNGGTFRLVGVTDKTFRLQLVEAPYFPWGLTSRLCAGDVVSLRRDGYGGPHAVNEWLDGTFTVYPFRAGLPHYFTPITEGA